MVACPGTGESNEVNAPTPRDSERRRDPPPPDTTYQDPLCPPGDVLLSINGQDLTYLSHSEAVGTLKASAASPSVQLRVLEVSMVEDHDHDELLPHTHDSDFDANWSPSWVMWLGLPR